MVYDLCIVGAGMWGSTAARYASAHPELNVCLVGPEEPATPQEFASRDIFGAHYDAGRIYMKLFGSNHTGRVRSVLSERSIARFAELEAKSGIKFHKEAGCVFFGDVHSTFASIPDDVSIEMAASIRNWYPYIDISRDGPTAVYAKNSTGYLDPRKYIKAQVLLARRQGCDVVSDVAIRVTEADQPQGFMLVETEGGKRIAARKVLLCTGAFTQFKDLLPEGRKLDASVTSDVTVRFEIDESCTQRLHDMPCLSSEFDKPSPRECYILPPITYPDGKVYIKIGHGRCIDSTLITHDDVRRWYTDEADKRTVEILKDIFHSVIKGVKPLSEVIYTCADLDTPTELPYCDMVTGRLGVLVGGNSFGATMAEEVGRMGADMISGKEDWGLDIPKEDFKAKFVED